MFKGDVIINGEEYVLFSTQDDYEHPDLETAINCCKKEDWDKIVTEYEDADCMLHKTHIFKMTYEDMKEFFENL